MCVLAHAHKHGRRQPAEAISLILQFKPDLISFSERLCLSCTKMSIDVLLRGSGTTGLTIAEGGGMKATVWASVDFTLAVGTRAC